MLKTPNKCQWVVEEALPILRNPLEKTSLYRDLKQSLSIFVDENNARKENNHVYSRADWISGTNAACNYCNGYHCSS
jgi:hypothetical protein